MSRSRDLLVQRVSFDTTSRESNLALDQGHKPDEFISVAQPETCDRRLERVSSALTLEVLVRRLPFCHRR
ncbi:hypothetical protein [Pseudomonas sp. PAMC 26793]|uniref:hypothetical protein n=1 Tax=Pseudomonas sp. PAMC 26793 TaxID=1240676 RepID=UPI0002D85B88|nr:hypothetical protein [Pseudomonas sp. PAMC 26793]